MIYRLIKSGIIAMALAGGFASSAFASDGVFDFLDPCIGAREQFSDQRTKVFEQIATQVSNTDTATATTEYRADWLTAKKTALRPIFDQQVKPLLADLGVTDFDAAYGKWFDFQIAQLSPEQLQALQDQSFRVDLKAFWIGKQKSTAAEIDKQHDELSKSCKMDVGNQALRVAIIGAMKPITFMVDNWKSGEHGGFINQVIKTPTGIDVVDAVKCPIRGCSSESVPNKVLKALGF